MSLRRSQRKIKIKIEDNAETSTSTKWSGAEISKYLNCVMENGHKNLEKLQECFPYRNLETIKSFLRTAYDKAVRLQEGHSNIDAWIQRSIMVDTSPPWKDCLQIARVIKYLSVDGLIENHPLPSQCQGINFSEAYRLVYQALMGYPIQPVNQETASFVISTLVELVADAMKEMLPTQNVNEFLKRKAPDNIAVKKERISKNNINNDTSENDMVLKKPLKVYSRKKPKLSIDDQAAPSLKIVVEPQDTENCNGTRDFSLKINGNNDSTVINLPVPVKMQSFNNVKQEEEDLLNCSTYNPFKFPFKWLTEPFHLNLLDKNVTK